MSYTGPTTYTYVTDTTTPEYIDTNAILRAQNNVQTYPENRISVKKSVEFEPEKLKLKMRLDLQENTLVMILDIDYDEETITCATSSLDLSNLEKQE